MLSGKDNIALAFHLIDLFFPQTLLHDFILQVAVSSKPSPTTVNKLCEYRKEAHCPKCILFLSVHFPITSPSLFPFGLSVWIIHQLFLCFFSLPLLLNL